MLKDNQHIQKHADELVNQLCSKTIELLAEVTTTTVPSIGPSGRLLHGQCITSWSIQTMTWRADITDWTQKPTNVIWTSNSLCSCRRIRRSVRKQCKSSQSYTAESDLSVITGATLRPAAAWPSQTDARHQYSCLVVCHPRLYCVRLGQSVWSVSWTFQYQSYFNN